MAEPCRKKAGSQAPLLAMPEGKKAAGMPGSETLEQLGIRQRESMKKHTSFRVGGPADFFARPESIDALKAVLSMARHHELAITIMGGGTNMLVTDKGIRGLVISLAGLKNALSVTPGEKNAYQVTAAAGMSLAALYRETRRAGIGGLAFTAGIPGTMGGAVMMNAGTAAGTMEDVIHSIDLLDGTNGIVTLEKKDLVFGRRSLDFATNMPATRCPILVGATLLLEKQAPEIIRAHWEELLSQRQHQQPAGTANAGCFFKNPPGAMGAGALIDRCGLKGMRIGDAAVSEKHANFILNRGAATARDILALKQHIEQTVYTRFGIRLENEVKIEGE